MGCDEASTSPAPDPPPPRWDCPADWVPYAAGGCAPRSVVAPAPDAATPWPAADWSPDAGIPTCPDGWTRAADGTCDPRADRDCGDTAGPLPGDRCTPTRVDDCPEGPFPALPVEATGHAVAYVDAASRAAPTGDPAHPWTTLDDAITHTHDGDWILLAPGDYDAHHTVVDRRHLLGLCAARVTLRGPDDAPALQCDGPAASLDLRGVTLRGGTASLSVTAHATAMVSACVLTDPGEHAVRAEGRGTTVSLTGVRIDDRRHLADGVSVHDGASATLRDVSLRGCATRALQAEDRDSTLTATRLVVDDTATAPASHTQGHALDVTAAAQVELREFVLRRAHRAAVHAAGAGSVVLSDGVVDDTLGVDDDPHGRGLYVDDAGTARVTRVLFSRSREDGVAVEETGSTLHLSQSEVRDTHADGPDGLSGLGLRCEHESQVTLEGVRVLRNHSVGVLIIDHARADLTDVRIEGTRGVGDAARTGRGLEVRCGAAAEARRLLIVDNQNGAVTATGDDDLNECITATTLHMTDSVLASSRPRADGTSGRGVAAQHGGRIALERVRVTANVELGVFVTNRFGVQTSLDVVDSLIEDTREATWTLDGGTNTLAGAGAMALDLLQPPQGMPRPTTLDLTRVELRGNHEAGVLSGGPGARVVARDVRVVDTLPSHRGFGVGIGVGSGGVLEGDRVSIERPSGAGVFVENVRDIVPGASHVSLRDALIVGVRESQITLRASNDGRPAGLSFAMGVQVGASHGVDLTRVVIDQGGYGLSSGGGDVLVTDGVVARQQVAFGALHGTDERAMVLTRVVSRANASPGLVPLTNLGDESFGLPSFPR